MEFVELTADEVKKLRFSCANFLQSWEMYRRYQVIGRESYFMGLKKGKTILAAGLMLARPWHFGKKVFRVAGGWLMDYDRSDYADILAELTRQAQTFCRQHHSIALEIAPNLVAQPRDAHNQILPGTNHLNVRQTLETLGYKYLGEFEQVKWTFVLDLAGRTAEELFRAFRTDHRQRIRRAERDGVRVRELGERELDILKNIAAEAGERHGFQDPDLEYYRSMREAFGSKIKFVVAEIPADKISTDKTSLDKTSDERSQIAKTPASTTISSAVKPPDTANSYTPLAAAMFVNDGREMVYLYSGSVRKLQKYGGAHLIQWQMIQEALRTGCTRYNFYGVYPVEGNGVYNFKLGFRGSVEELLGTFILPIGKLGQAYIARLEPHEYGAIH